MAQIIVVGAGLAGLSCAQQLQSAGHQVTILEKSRGVGGRLATRRVADTWLDHGVRYLEAQGDLTRSLIAQMTAQHILQPWPGTIAHWSAEGSITVTPESPTPPRYIAPQGITAIAKALATSLTINRQQQVVELVPTSIGWEVISTQVDTGEIRTDPAAAVILAIPAPQALALVQALPGLSAAAIAALTAVEFDPCLSVMAGYAEISLEQVHQAFGAAIAITSGSHPAIAWLSQEQLKSGYAHPTLLIQSSAGFAADHFADADLTQVTDQLLQAAAIALGDWITQPSWTQLHRWRYALVRRPHPDPDLWLTDTAPLIACGDWCGGDRMEKALQSGAIAGQNLVDRLAALG